MFFSSVIMDGWPTGAPMTPAVGIQGEVRQIVVRGVDQGQARRGRKLVYPSSERAQRGCTILENGRAL